MVAYDDCIISKDKIKVDDIRCDNCIHNNVCNCKSDIIDMKKKIEKVTKKYSTKVKATISIKCYNYSKN